MGPGLPPTSQWAWENITFIVRASEIEWKASLWGDFLPCFKATKDTYYVSLQYTYIVYLLQSHVCKTLNIHTKANTWDIMVEFPIEYLKRDLCSDSLYRVSLCISLKVTRL